MSTARATSARGTKRRARQKGSPGASPGRRAVAFLCAFALCVMGVPAAGLAIPGQALADALNGTQQAAEQAQSTQAQATTAAETAAVTVAYNAGIGSGDLGTANLAVGSTLARPAALTAPNTSASGVAGVSWSIAYTNWQFAGWSTRQNATKAEKGLAAGDTVDAKTVARLSKRLESADGATSLPLYAVWSAESGVLTLQGGTLSDNTNTASTFYPWTAKQYAPYITNVVFGGEVKVAANAAYLFAGLSKVQTLDLARLDTTTAVDLRGLLDGCGALTSLGTGSNWRNVDDPEYTPKDAAPAQANSAKRATLPVAMVSPVALFAANTALASGAVSYRAPGKDSYAVVFNANGGTFGGGLSAAASGKSYFGDGAKTLVDPFAQGASGQSIGEVLAAQTPSLQGCTFGGWYTAAVGGTRVTDTTTLPKANTTYYAHWSLNAATPRAIYGGVAWSIDTNGKLTLSAAETPQAGYEAGVLAPSLGYTYTSTTDAQRYFPWYTYRNVINAVRVQGRVTTSQNASGLFSGLANVEQLNLTNLDTRPALNLSSMFDGCSSIKELRLGTRFSADTENSNSVKRAGFPVRMYDAQNVYSSGSAVPYGAGAYTAAGDETFTVLNANGGDASKVFTNAETGDNGEQRIVDVSSGKETSLVAALKNTEPKLDNCTFTGWRYTDNDGSRKNVWSDSSRTSLVDDIANREEGDATYYASYSLNSGASVNGTAGGVDWRVSNGALTIGPSSTPQSGYARGTLDMGISRPWNAFGDVVTSITLQDGVVAPVNMNGLFSGFAQTRSIDISHLSTTSVASMSSLFSGCKALTTITGLDSLSTSNVTSMAYMFNGCQSLTNLALASFNTSNVCDMSSMFAGCRSLTSLDLSSFQTSKVTSMSRMFYNDAEWNILDDDGKATDEYGGISQLTTLNLSGFDVSKVRNMSSAFRNLRSLTTLSGISNWDVGSCTTFSRMFASCGATNFTLDVSGWDVSRTSDLSWMFFQGCSSAQLDLASWDVSNAKNMDMLFAGANLGSLDVSTWNTSNVAVMGYLFDSATVSSGLDLSHFDVSGLPTGYSTGLQCAFRYASIPDLNISGWDASRLTEGQLYHALWSQSLKRVNMSGMHVPPSQGSMKNLIPMGSEEVDASDLVGVGEITSFTQMFGNLSNMRSFNISGWDVSNVQSMSQMFYGSKASKLTSLDLSGWDVRNCTDFYQCFSSLTSLKTLNLSGWKALNNNSVKYVFAGCLANAEYIDASNWEWDGAPFLGFPYWTTSPGQACKSLNLSDWHFSTNPTSFANLFSGQKYLENIDLSGWATSNVTNMDNMFQDCTSLKSFDVTGWDTSAVTQMKQTFLNCSALESLDLSGWNTSKVTSFAGMFKGCSSLTSLDLSNFSVTASYYDKETMFAGCTGLTKLRLGANWKYSNDAHKAKFSFRVGSISPTLGSETDAAIIEGTASGPDSETGLTGVEIPHNTDGKVRTYYSADNAHSIDYVLDGGKLDKDYPVVYTSDTEAFTLDAPTKDGYVFAGWKDASGKDLGKTVEVDPSKAEGDLSFTATWTKKSVAVVFTDASGFNPNAEKTFVAGDTSNNVLSATFDIDGEVTTWARKGYTLTTWKDSTGKRYAVDSVVQDSWIGEKAAELAESGEKSLSLEAVWMANTYTIRYDGNGSDSGTVANSVGTYGTDPTLSSGSGLAKAGYALIGWNTQADGSGTQYAQGAVATDFEAADENVLYAQWAWRTYKIEYDLAGGTLASGVSNPGTYDVNSSAIALNNPTRAGYEFAGWTGTDLDAASASVTIASGSQGDRAYTATWEPVAAAATELASTILADVDLDISNITAASTAEDGSQSVTIDGAVTITTDANGKVTVKLEDVVDTDGKSSAGTLNGTLTIPDNLGDVEVDLSGGTISALEGDNAIEVVSSGAADSGNVTSLVITDTSEAGTGTIKGGNSSNLDNSGSGIAVKSSGAGQDSGVAVAVAGGTVTGGAGSGEKASGSGIEVSGAHADVTVEGGAVTGGTGANGAAGGSGISVSDESGSVNVAVDGGTVSGGNGGNSTGSASGGDGGNAVSGNGNVAVNGGAVAGGNGGSSESGNGGAGGGGATGASVAVYDGTASGGTGGSSDSGTAGNGGAGAAATGSVSVSGGSATGGEGGSSANGTAGDGGSGASGATTTVTGGTASGGTGGTTTNGSAGDGGSGASGVTTTVKGGSTSGGTGGTSTGSGSAGDGGDGATATQSTTISGGTNAGGSGGAATGSGNAGSGGSGATTGTTDENGTFTPSGTVTVSGGSTSGGEGGDAASGNAGDGGSGAKAAETTVSGTTTNVSGGSGGNSESGNAGNGGSGATATEKTTVTGGTTSGGEGGNTNSTSADSKAGNGGAGAVSTGTNGTTTISGGSTSGGEGGSANAGTGGSGGSGAAGGTTTVSGSNTSISGGTGGDSETGVGGSAGTAAEQAAEGDVNTGDAKTSDGDTGVNKHNTPGAALLAKLKVNGSYITTVDDSTWKTVYALKQAWADLANKNDVDANNNATPSQQVVNNALGTDFSAMLDAAQAYGNVAEAFGGASKVDVAIDANGNVAVTLIDDVAGSELANGGVQLPDNMGDVTIDLNGHNITGADATGTSGTGTAAITIVAGEGAGNGSTGLVITDSNPVTDDEGNVVNGITGGTGATGGSGIQIAAGTEGVSVDVAGGSVAGGASTTAGANAKGGSGIAAAEGAKGATATVSGEGSVSGGAGAAATGSNAASAGGSAISGNAAVSIEGGSVAGGSGGASVNGAAGSGGTAIDTTNSVAVSGGSIAGGAGGTSTGSGNAGSGGAAVETSIEGDNAVVVSGGSVEGGAGGEATGTGNAGAGAAAIEAEGDVVVNSDDGATAISGGTGGAAASGKAGNGGAAVETAGNATVSGGSVEGGSGGAASGTAAGATGGSGGAGVVGTGTNSAVAVSGGNVAGGTGGASVNGAAGSGGSGAQGAASTTVSGGTTAGGAGGAASGTGAGGTGGAGATTGTTNASGVFTPAGTTTVTGGTASGGEGGAAKDGNAGAGGAGAAGKETAVSGGTLAGGEGGSTSGTGTAGSGGAGATATDKTTVKAGEDGAAPSVAGGEGGAATGSGNAGAGGAGAATGTTSANGTFTPSGTTEVSGGSVSGGEGGNAASGNAGSGGAGATAATTTVSGGSAAGGEGGNSESGNAGDGGAGATATTKTTVSGGTAAGGEGGSTNSTSATSKAGSGGAGASTGANGTTEVSGGTLAGGEGGSANAGTAGSGGSGATGGTTTVSGTGTSIAAGNGGDSETGAAGSVGAVAEQDAAGDVTIPSGVATSKGTKGDDGSTPKSTAFLNKLKGANGSYITSVTKGTWKQVAALEGKWNALTVDGVDVKDADTDEQTSKQKINAALEAAGGTQTFAEMLADTAQYAQVAELFGGASKVDVEISGTGENAVTKVTLIGDVNGTVELDDKMGAVEIDLNGHDITGTAGSATSDGKAGIEIAAAAEGATGSATKLKVTDTAGGGSITGGSGANGGSGIAVAGGTQSVNVDVAAGEVAGGDATAAGGNGGSGVSAAPSATGASVAVTGEAAKVTGGDGASASGKTAGGSGGAAVSGSAAVSVSAGTVEGGSGGTSSGTSGAGNGGAAIDTSSTVAISGGSVEGGSGGTSATKAAGGSGGAAVKTSAAVTDAVTVSGGAISGGSGGANSGSGSSAGTGGTGGAAIQAAGDVTVKAASDGTVPSVAGGTGGASKNGSGGTGGSAVETDAKASVSAGNVAGGTGGASSSANENSTAGSGGAAVKGTSANSEVVLSGGSVAGGEGGATSGAASAGNGGEGVTSDEGASVTTTVSGAASVAGGEGGTSTGSGKAGDGGAGTSGAGNTTVSDTASVAGGEGGKSTGSGDAGSGGAGTAGTGTTTVNGTAKVEGGTGGESTGTGAAGDGGAGVEGGTVAGSGTVTGGTGGESITGQGGSGGAGAVNAEAASGSTVSVSGGTGGDGVTAGEGGSQSATVAEDGTVTPSGNQAASGASNAEAYAFIATITVDGTLATTVEAATVKAIVGSESAWTALAATDGAQAFVNAKLAAAAAKYAASEAAAGPDKHYGVYADLLAEAKKVDSFYEKARTALGKESKVTSANADDVAALADEFNKLSSEERAVVDGMLTSIAPKVKAGGLTKLLTETDSFANLSEATVTLEEGTWTYTGAAIEPAVTVELDGKTLRDETDYAVSYSDNVNAGTATVTVKGTSTGKYNGSKAVTFTIAPASISGATLTALVDGKASAAFTDKTIEPALALTVGTGDTAKTLVLGTDYGVTWSGAGSSVKAVGTYTATVTGKGNWTGRVTAANVFEVTEGSTAMAANEAFTAGSYGYKVTAARSTVQLTNAASAKGSYTVPASVKGIDGKTYRVTSVAKGAFTKSAATQVTLGANVTSIAAGAFLNDTKVKTVKVQGAVTKIDKQVFQGCTALTSVTVTSSKITSIEASAFLGAKKLKTLTVNKSTKLKSFGKNALKGTAKKLTVKVSKKIKKKAYNKLAKKIKKAGNKKVKVKKG